MSAPTYKTAQEIAHLLDRDPIMAGYITHVLGRDRVCELLNIPNVKTEEEKDEEGDGENSDSLNEIVNCYDVHEILAAYRNAGKN